MRALVAAVLLSPPRHISKFLMSLNFQYQVISGELLKDAKSGSKRKVCIGF